MRLFFAVVVFLIFSFNGVGQITGEGETYLVMERINPTFRGGGMKEFYSYINTEFDYSKVSAKGKMVASFTINELGEIKNIKVTQFLDIESATEIIRVLKNAPKWVPAKRNAKPISVDITLPLDFGSNKNKAIDESAVAKEDKANSKSESKTTTSDVVDAVAVESKPLFAGGLTKFYSYIGSSFRAPEMTSFKGGRMIVSFVVEKDGSLTDIKILKDIGFGTAYEAIRVLKASPKWTPAQQNGKPVRCIYTLPIKIASYKVE